MNVEIITIGDELLIGQVIDTNSAWMAQELNKFGFYVYQRTAVGDSAAHIVKAINEAIKRVDIVLITGGLGPTKDDITKHTLCKYFKSKLVVNKVVLNDIKKMFKDRHRVVSPVNLKQAEVPDNCICIRNKNGTAPGMWFHHKNKIIVSMPGVPYEMKGMMTDGVLPRLKKTFITPHIVHSTILTQGIGESTLAEMIEKWEDALPPNMKLAYLPAPGMVRLRLTAIDHDKKIKGLAASQIKKLKPLISKYIYGEGDDNLPELIATLLVKKKKTLSLAESCTGGYISHLITSMPGCSAFYLGSVISYDNFIKESFLDVPAGVLKKHGAVSEETVTFMAKNIKKKFKTDYAIATSGVAGPSGGTDEKPVGLVWIGIATPTKVFAKKIQYGTDRMRNIHVFSQTALNMLRLEIESE